jgi:hypothetical protein
MIDHFGINCADYGYFGAFVRDPDGNNVEAVCQKAAAVATQSAISLVHRA